MNKIKYIIISTLAIVCLSCSNNNKNGQANNTNSKQESESTTDSTQVRDATSSSTYISQKNNADSSNIDAVSSATAIANPAMFNGTLIIAPNSFASISLSMPGIVKSLNILAGNYIKKGDIIAQIENPDFIKLQQEFLEASAQLEYLQAEYNRQVVLAKEDAVSGKKLQQSKADFISMRAKVNSSSAQLKLLGLNNLDIQNGNILPYISVKAPISGYIADVNVNLGKHLESGSPICSIVDKSKIMIKLLAYEKDLPTVFVGARVQFRVNGLGDKVFKAKIISIGQKVDNDNRSVEMYAKIEENNSNFRPGMYVSARVEEHK